MNIHHTDYVTGNRFVELADYAITTNDFVIDWSKIKTNQIIFCKTDKLLEFFEGMRERPEIKVILITHNSDHNITEEIVRQKPDNILHWFAQNVLVERPYLTPIPIGLENKGVGGSSDYELVCDISNGQIERDIFCYCNISPGTNTVERSFDRNKSFITNDYDRLSFNDYLLKVRRSLFVISPPGNGHDCHRTWESIYLGAIPVMKSSPSSEYFSRFCSIMIVDDFNSLSESDFPVHESSRWNAVARMSWWKEKIEATYFLCFGQIRQ